MSNIKVTVEYEKPNQDRFSALMEQYKAAKAVADETKNELQPLIDAGTEAKYKAICEQVKEFGKRLCEAVWRNGKYESIGGYFGFSACVGEGYGGGYLHISTEKDGPYVFNCNYRNVDLFRPDAVQTKEIQNLVREWNNYKPIEQLNADLEWAWKYEIKRQMTKTENIRKDLAVIQEG